MLKKLSPLSVLLLLIFLIWFIFHSSMPRNVETGNIPQTEFSSLRAFQDVTQIGKAPHFVGSNAHSVVRNYIVNELQLLDLEVQTQEGYSLTNEGVISRSQNILAKIPGTGRDKALLLMSHYDSAGHSSFGASDAGSGVATLLEGIRVFLAKNELHKNDIILLFTDAEELGLNGAELFVKEHPWAKEVGLALNFESRGSGGNSFMLLETNGGNAALIQHFIKAKPEFPVTNSLAYSVYKMLPNDTDLTVLREQGNINGFNFAFIGDHFDYHTANDIPANLDKETLAHQGSYLIPLLDYFKDADLTILNSQKDQIYFSLPFGKMINYPFSWIFPMLLIGFGLFFVVLSYGFFKKKINLKAVLKGAVPFLSSMFGAAILVFLLWQFCLMIYPEYAEMEQGFTYNGYYYIASAIFLSLSLCFLIYHKVGTPEKQAGDFIFPLFFWLLICALTAFYLEGAAYFIIPLYFGSLQLLLMLWQKSLNPWLMLLLSMPALVLLLPFVATFPVALGLKILYVTAILTVFLFIFFLPVFAAFNRKKALGLLLFLIFNIIFITAHFKSGFTQERPKPNSLVYLLDTDAQLATWNSYDKLIDPWTQNYFGEDPVIIPSVKEGFSSKYGSGFTYRSEAPVVDIPEPGIVFEKLKTSERSQNINRYSLKIAPNRKINRMEFFVDRSFNFEEFKVNGLVADSIYLGANPFHVFTKRWLDRLLIYHAANRDTLRLEFAIEGEKLPDFILYEASYDLLENENLGVTEREKTMIPRPFVLNDAVILKKTIKLD